MSRSVNLGNFEGLADLASPVEAALEEWRSSENTQRLWSGDASLWTGDDEAEWLGWLEVVDGQLDRADELASLTADLSGGEFDHVLLLGMGGSSLCPEVLKMTFGAIAGHPELFVLDSTDPAQVKSFENEIDLERSAFFVSSKSGTTLEPNIFMRYFFERVSDRVGAEAAAEHFIAVTDPGSPLEEIARRDGFRHVFHGVPGIGGRYSALSDFGMAPAAAMGLDVRRLLERARIMVNACDATVPDAENPGVRLGLALGTAGALGRDKITLIASPAVYDLGAWLEQLLAESTGKQGVALIPVDREPLGEPGVYEDDRLFVYVRFADGPDPEQDAALERLESAGQPVIRIDVDDRYDLGQEFFRWEFATAVAGSLLGINPFNQPDVEASKKATRALTDSYEDTGSLPSEEPILEEKRLWLLSDSQNAEALASAADDRNVEAYLRAHLGRLEPGDYLALLAYIEMNEAHEARLSSIRRQVRDARRVATCLGFGPRFLHSTGQAYKGGPNTGVFLQITCDDAEDLDVPGHDYTFGVVKAAQARGDFEVLAERGRRALRVHLGADVEGGLKELERQVGRALA
ncbi:MAG: bifunctional transaldolase/phosoglucose isomerase [Gemmatimonadetes bacterium]|uniref:Glucose-6-phosphate isomerase n=1 Tax=Candidatus Kutchimonas denitrificans TaxID=3056748 RepID=A0AAE4ZCA7_9BACT|nr:bifunctional transaldolase/phosoglucose isomerase [Gemmatimonadota bacterium]NIR75821.1 bifunctional transaldolase/phosoglucose isomerase [Candidatus Kutchimonas denitrificans]NIS01989.1 bifunctional transaldolase/phosoglucose isomerase [Gemmatimonadota bacterium]NIT67793.1 bifunctional transaldolase/phosoglucose isomerase [Gemmatimonadota bacterium]NIU53780.1 bifunctional transaldolase/phosoglucose isomerase [Gemmatimonadota bacterium]